jgi:hypothetical protein
MRQKAFVIPNEIEDLRQRLEHWRSTHKRRGRIPEALWAEAAELARQHGVYQTARTLRLEYTMLWYWSQQLHKPAGRSLDAAVPPEFVELIAPPAPGLFKIVGTAVPLRSTPLRDGSGELEYHRLENSGRIAITLYMAENVTVAPAR